VNIGIIGAGTIGSTLTRRLAAAGHDVVVANSRGPHTIPADVLETGGRAVHAADAVRDVDVLITSVPLLSVPDLAPLLAGLPADAVVVDTSNYYPLRDGHIDAIDAGQVESLWVCEQLGRPVIKAWNAITSGSFAARATPAGDPARIAIPVAGDSEDARVLAMAVIAELGVDASRVEGDLLVRINRLLY